MATTQTRRAMIWTLVSLPAGLFLVHCGSSSSNGGGGTAADAPAVPPVKSATSITYASSVVSSHYHTFLIESADLASPPEGGVNGPTSSVAGHVHTVSVSATQLENVNAGDSVKVRTSVSAGHSHVFTFVRVA